jgi:TDG/mug DNA glycosylase family protein
MMITDLNASKLSRLDAAKPAATDGLAKSRGFPPVVGPAPRVLLLGSLPGRASLAAGRYYAQRRNAFWPIMNALCGAGPELPYRRRLAALKRAGIALWDVLLAAERRGSLDAAIVTATLEINAIAEFLATQPQITCVGFNGQKAATLFRRYVEPHMPARPIALVTLPSTSPAYASLRVDQKAARWQRLLAPHLGSD